MMKKQKFILPIILSVAMISSDVCAIRQGTAQFVSAGAGLAAGGVGTVCGGQQNGFVGSLVGGVLSGGIIGGLTYFILYWFTPQGRMSRAKGCISRIGTNRIATDDLVGKGRVLDVVREQYISSDVYLATACHDLTVLLKDAYQSIELLECACMDTDEQEFIREANELIWFTRQAIPRITQAIKIIRDCPDYAKQLRILEERRIEREKLQLQYERNRIERDKAWSKERMANAWAGHR